MKVDIEKKMKQLTQEDLIESARRLVKCNDENQQGLATWHILMEELYQDLLKNILTEEERKKQ